MRDLAELLAGKIKYPHVRWRGCTIRTNASCFPSRENFGENANSVGSGGPGLICESTKVYERQFRSSPPFQINAAWCALIVDLEIIQLSVIASCDHLDCSGLMLGPSVLLGKSYQITVLIRGKIDSLEIGRKSSGKLARPLVCE